MMSRLYLFPLCSVTKNVWSSVRRETHVDKVPAESIAKRVWLCAAEAGYRECAYANDCHWACDRCAGSSLFPALSNLRQPCLIAELAKG